MVELAIVLGLVFSLIVHEVFGLAAGGMIVPGYIALQLASPGQLIGLFVVSLITWGILKLIGRTTFLFGRRQLAFSVLVGCLLAVASRRFFDIELDLATVELRAVGWVIPGLIAHWYTKQGVVQTTCVLVLTATLVRLVVILSFGGAPLPH